MLREERREHEHEQRHEERRQERKEERREARRDDLSSFETPPSQATVVAFPAYSFLSHGARVAFFNLGHMHFLSADLAGTLSSHSDISHRETTWHIEREGDRLHIRSHHGGYLAAHADGSFNARGERHHSHWYAEATRDGSVALKAHNVSWYLGVSVFGGAEAVEVLGSDRCHFRVDVDVDVDVAGGVVMSQPALQPVMVVQSQPEPVIVIERPVVAAVQSPFLAHGAKVTFFNLGHMHFLGADFDGTLVSHSDRSHRETTWHIEREGDRLHIRSHHGGYLAAHADGSFNARGERHHSHWHAEATRDGSVALKAHNVSWYLGVSVFGGAEAVEVLGSDRCHFRVDVDVDVDVAGGVVMSQPALQPVMVVQSQPEPVIVIERPVVAAVQSPFLAHGAKVAFFNLGHMHFLGADFDGTLVSHSDRSHRETTWHIEREGDGLHIRSHHGGYLAAHADGSFNARGERHHSHWHAEATRDGSVALKAHNVSWYLGVSVFGGAEAVEVLGSDRCHFRVDVDVDVDVAGTVDVVVCEPQSQQQQSVVVVESQPELLDRREERKEESKEERRVEEHEGRREGHHHHRNRNHEEEKREQQGYQQEESQIVVVDTNLAGETIIVKGAGVVYDDQGFAKRGRLMKKARLRGRWVFLASFFTRPWALRHMQLHRDKVLKYFDGDSFKGEININGCLAREIPPRDADGNVNAFCIFDIEDNEILVLSADNENERVQWIAAINAVACRY